MQSQVKNLSMNIIKDLSGLSYTDKQLEFMNEIVPDIGPTSTRSQFNGKSKNLLRFFEQVKEANQEVLKDGIVTEGSKEHKQALLDNLKNKASSFTPPVKHQFTREEIEAERERRKSLQGGK